jgi:hypothetical protein
MNNQKESKVLRDSPRVTLRRELSLPALLKSAKLSLCRLEGRLSFSNEKGDNFSFDFVFVSASHESL